MTELWKFLVRLGEAFLASVNHFARLWLGEPVTMLRPIFMACFGVNFVARSMIVYGLLRGHCMTCLRVSLLD